MCIRDRFRKELAGLENKNVKGLIVDLRDKPGGLMDQGIEVADMLLPECTICLLYTSRCV